MKKRKSSKMIIGTAFKVALIGQFVTAQNLQLEGFQPFSMPSTPVRLISWRPIEMGPGTFVRSPIDFAYASDNEIRYFNRQEEKVLWKGKISKAPYLKWSSTGDLIAFVGYVNNSRGLVIHDLRTNGNHLISGNEGVLISSAWHWSPAGQQIAFTEKVRIPDVKYPGGIRDEYYFSTSEYDGSDLQRIGEGSVESWSPVGSNLLVLRGEEVQSDNHWGFRKDHYLWLVDLVEGSERKLALPPASRPLFSPTGLKFYFRARGKREINIFDVKKDQFLSVPFDQVNSEHTWSPDGTRLAFTAFETRQIDITPEEKLVNSDIWVVNADGTGLANLTNTGEGTFERAPHWVVGNRIVIEQETFQGPKHTVVLKVRPAP